MREIFFNVNPKGKGRPRFSNTGKFVQTYTDPQTRAYEDDIRKQYLAEAVNKGWEPLQGPLSIEISFRMPIPKSASKKLRQDMIQLSVYHVKKPDIDNLTKSVLDALNGAAWEDDKQICEMVVRRIYAERPGIKMKIMEV